MEEPVKAAFEAIDALNAARDAQVAVVSAEQEKLSQIDRALSTLNGKILVTNKVLDKSFADLGIVQAAKLFLKEVGEEKTTKDIADVLLERGVITRSKRFVPTVYATLRNSKDFIRRGDHWVLREDK